MLLAIKMFGLRYLKKKSVKILKFHLDRYRHTLSA